ncbi:MAG: protein kinase [Polyangiales bacterium]
MLSPGDRVEDYEVIAPLRSGGMAMLYLARRRGVGGFSRLVALKLVHPHLLKDETIHQLFLNEARISAAVAHPNVVNVEEIGQAGESYFIAMEYVHGVSLSELLTSLRERRLRMSQKLCVWVVGQIAEALHAVHEATSEHGLPLNIVHHDVSPQNVLIGHTGHVKLIDFGIARSHLHGQQTGNGFAVLGKPGYMAPEQLQNQSADRRSDVYALGVMLWEMLTSRSLFRCQQLDDERDWTLRENPVAPSIYAPISSASLDEVVLKALAPDPRDRFESAFEFRAALLRADASALLVDAPTFATLMRSMLGHELERQRAKLPSEVSIQLDLDAEVITSRSVPVEELTSEILAAEPRAPIEEERTTLIESPAAARRGEHATTDLPSSELMLLDPFEPLGPVSSHVRTRPPTVPPPQAEIVTIASPPSVAPPRRTRRQTRREKTIRATWVGAVCLALGMALGAAVSGKEAPAPLQPMVLRVRPTQLQQAPLEPAPKPTEQPEKAHVEHTSIHVEDRALASDAGPAASLALEAGTPRARVTPHRDDENRVKSGTSVRRVTGEHRRSKSERANKRKSRHRER